jgi:hypothetical protein
MSGWIKLHRSLKKHWLMDDPEYLRAWVLILMEVNHSEKKVLIKKKLLLCGEGESLMSTESWGRLFGNWGRSRVTRFFAMLEDEGMIKYKSEKVTSRLIVCKWGTYQDTQTGDSTARGTVGKHSANSTPPTNKNVKNEENEEEFDFSWENFKP